MEDTNTMSSVTVNGGGAENAVPEKTPMSGGRRAALIAGILLGVLAVAYLAACVVTQTVYGSTALPHTDVLGLDVSKLTAQQIETLWEEKSPQLLHDTAVSLTEKGERIGAVPLDTLGVTVTPQAASIAAGASQRYESWGGGALAWLRGGWSYIHSWFWQTSAVPQLTVDAAALDAACNELAASLNCTVVDGGYRLEKGEGLYITKPADGRMLDAGKLESDLTAMLQSGALTPVACTYEEKKAQTVDIRTLHDQLAGEKAEAVCNKETGEPTESRVGVAFDVAAVQAQLDAAAPGAEFLADAQVEFPNVSTEELKDCMFRDVLGTYTTKCAGPWGRHQNIKLASAAINGKIYNPGEEFWYNATVGQRTAARGYQEAGVYEAGRTTTGIGGGICQVSSTLYYAVLLSDLDIVLRYCHMFNPGYMPIGCDATVSWGGPDFAFRNSRDYPIKIVTSYNDDTNELTCTILGTKVDDHYVVMTNAVLASYDYQTVYQESPDVAPGEEVIDQYGHTGYHVRTWRNIYDGDGSLLSSRVEADSHYDVGNKIILVAPGYLPADNG